MTALERRADVLRMLRSSLEERSVFFLIGGENPQPELRSVSVVGANYGLGHRNLGAVGVVGPLRMDYALRSPRSATPPASSPATSRPSTAIAHAARLLRGPRGLPGGERDRDQEGVPPPGAGAAPRRQRPRSRGGGEVQGGRRRLRGPLRRRAAAHLRRLRPRGPALGRVRAGGRFRLDRRHLPGLLRRRRRLRRPPGGRRRRRRGGGRGRAGGGRDRRPPRGHLRRRRQLRALPRQRRRAGDADHHLRALRRRRRAAPGDADAVRADGPGRPLRRLRRQPGKSRRQPCGTCGGGGRTRQSRTSAIEVPAGIEDGQRMRITGAGHAGEAGAPAGRPLRRGPGRPRTSASSARAAT